jgi:hypothetical protein
VRLIAKTTWLLFKQHEPIANTATRVEWRGEGWKAEIQKGKEHWFAFWRGPLIGKFRSRAAARHGLEKYVRKEAGLLLHAIGQGYMAVRLGL